MSLSTTKNNNDLGEVSMGVVFLRGDMRKNLDSLHGLVKGVASQIQGNQVQIWIETPESIRLWSVPSNLLISSYGDRIFTEDGFLVFRKQNHTKYVFEQHYQIVIVCPKSQLSKASKLVEDFRRKKASRGAVVMIPLEKPCKLTMHHCNS